MIAHEACYWHRHLQHRSNGKGEPYVLETKRHFEPGRLVFLVGNERAIRLTARKEYLSDLDVSMGDEGAAAGQNSYRIHSKHSKRPWPYTRKGSQDSPY